MWCGVRVFRCFWQDRVPLKKVWSRLKFLANEAGLDNYVIAEKPYTWTAFTFE